MPFFAASCGSPAPSREKRESPCGSGWTGRSPNRAEGWRDGCRYCPISLLRGHHHRLVWVIRRLGDDTAFWIATPPTRRSVRCIAICLPTTAPSRCPGRVRWRPRPGAEIHLAKALPADQRLRAYAQRIAPAHHHVPALSAKRSRPGDSARLEDKWKNWGFSDAEIKGREYWDQYIEAFTFAARSELQPRFSL